MMPCAELVVNISKQMIGAVQLADCKLMSRIINHGILNYRRGLGRHRKDVGVIQLLVCLMMPCAELVVNISKQMIGAV